MTTLITADLHLSSNPRDDYRWIFVNDTLPRLIRKHRVTKLLILGDLTEVKDNHGSRLVNRIVERMHELSRMVNPLIILRGNHDYKPGFPAFFSFLDRFSRILWIDGLTEHGDNLLLPHTHDWQRDWAPYMVDGVFRPGFRRIYAHQTFDGARVSRMRTMRGIPTSIFSDSTRVISGDVHVPQDDKVSYVGAPYTVDFGDDYEPRVLLIDDSGVPKSIAGEKMVDLCAPATSLITSSRRLSAS